MARSSAARDADGMMQSRLPREEPEGAEERPSFTECTFALWLVASLLGAMLATHYLLARALPGGDASAVSVAVPFL